MPLSFSVSQWSAWAPGLTSPEAWTAWAQAAPVAPVGTQTPPLTEVPAMARRRVERLGRPAFQAALWCQGETKGMPMIFASRHGDPGRSAELITALIKGEPLSPTSFALSVHNAIGAQYSIVRGDPVNVSAVANGLFTLEAAVLEAVTLFQEGHPEVLVVSYDAAPVPLFAPHYDEPDADFAFAWRLTPGTQFALELAPPAASAPDVLPHALAVFRFFLGGAREYTRSDAQSGWRWSRG